MRKDFNRVQWLYIIKSIYGIYVQIKRGPCACWKSVHSFLHVCNTILFTDITSYKQQHTPCMIHVNNSTSKSFHFFSCPRNIITWAVRDRPNANSVRVISTRRNQTEGVKLTKIILNYSDWRAKMTFFAFQITILSSKVSISFHFYQIFNRKLPILEVLRCKIKNSLMSFDSISNSTIKINDQG